MSQEAKSFIVCFSAIALAFLSMIFLVNYFDPKEKISCAEIKNLKSLYAWRVK